jgi:DNA-directed RNA polymerase specialized sigma24 family protein
MMDYRNPVFMGAYSNRARKHADRAAWLQSFLTACCSHLALSRCRSANRFRKHADPALTSEVTLRGSLERKFGEGVFETTRKHADRAAWLQAFLSACCSHLALSRCRSAKRFRKHFGSPVANPFPNAISPNPNRNRDRNRENDLSRFDFDSDPDFDLECREMPGARKSHKTASHSTSFCFSIFPSTDLINGFFNHG